MTNGVMVWVACIYFIVYFLCSYVALTILALCLLHQ